MSPNSCPYCTGLVEVRNWNQTWYCRCLSCNARTGDCSSAQEAITAWNNIPKKTPALHIRHCEGCGKIPPLRRIDTGRAVRYTLSCECGRSCKWGETPEDVTTSWNTRTPEPFLAAALVEIYELTERGQLLERLLEIRQQVKRIWINYDLCQTCGNAIPFKNSTICQICFKKGAHEKQS